MYLFEHTKLYLSIYTLTIIGIVMYLLIFHLDLFLNKEIINKIHNYTESCVINCSDKNTCKKINNLRDKGYYLFPSAHGKCIITKWEISHLITHIFLGYYTNIYISLSLSFGFEIYENIFYNCGSYLDLIWNFTGFLIGFYLRHKRIF